MCVCVCLLLTLPRKPFGWCRCVSDGLQLVPSQISVGSDLIRGVAFQQGGRWRSCALVEVTVSSTKKETFQAMHVDIYSKVSWIVGTVHAVNIM